MLITVAYKLHGWWRHQPGPRMGPTSMLQALRIQLREVMAAEWNEHDGSVEDEL